EQTLRHASNPFLGLEMTLVRMACIGRVQPLQSILEHLQRLETGLPAVSMSAATPEERPAAPLVPPARNGRLEDVQTAGQDAVGIVETAEGFWEALQQPVTERRPSLGGPMQHGRPVSLDEHRLVVGFAKSDKFSLEYLLDPENLIVVRDMAQALLGRPLQITLEPLHDETAGSPAASEARVATELEASAFEEAQRQKNELKQAVIDIFGATPI